VSDLIGIKLTLFLGVGFLVVLGAFFLIGPVVGVIVLLAAVVLGILAFVTAIRRAEVPPD
jgi:cation transporter-like permease